MKCCLLIGFIAITHISFCQNLPLNKESGMVEYSEVVSVDSTAAETLYSNAKLFIAEAARSAKEVTQMQDDATKTIIIKGNLVVDPLTYARCAITISCKDNRYKYIITDIVYVCRNPKANIGDTPIEREKMDMLISSKKQWERIKTRIDNEVKSYIIQLKTGMTKKHADW